MKKAIILLSLLIFSMTEAGAQANEKWMQDYEAMKRYMAEAYANLEWARGKIDLVALDRKTREDLQKATTDAEARKVLDSFLATFRDGHLSLREVKNENAAATGEKPSFAPDAAADKVCGALGYRIRLPKFSLPFDKAPNFRLVSTNKDYFPAGILTLETGKTFGVLNIALFMPEGFFGNCVESWNEYRAKLNTPCEGDCLSKFRTATANRLSAKLTEQIRILQAQKPNYLIVDIGSNGGGTDWVEAAARIISPKPLSRMKRGFIRHPHWAVIHQGNLGAVEADLKRKDLTAKQREYLKTAQTQLKKYIAETKSPCDRSFFWTTKEERKNCTQLNTTPFYGGGIFESLPAAEISNLNARDVLFRTDEFEYEPSVFKGNLIVLVDRKTASAAENFASYMQAAKAGEVVGEKTLGAGCGYVNGGTQYFLPNSKLRLWMPDCVRYRADGVNEVEGVAPDAAIWEATDEKPQKLEKLLAFLAQKR